jgi:hypothetical protein
VVWAGIDREWEAGDSDRTDLRQRVVRFCLRGLGVTAEVIEQICAEN